MYKFENIQYTPAHIKNTEIIILKAEKKGGCCENKNSKYEVKHIKGIKVKSYKSSNNNCFF